MKTVKCAQIGVTGNNPPLKEILGWAERRHCVDRMFATIYTDRVSGKWKPRARGVAKEVVRLFEPFILRVQLASAWPPRDFLRHPHIVCVMRYSPEVGEIMLKREPELGRWHNNNGLPEDICLFKSRSRMPAFVCSINDNEGFLIDPAGIEGQFWDTWEDTARVARRQIGVHSGYAFCREWVSQRHMAKGPLSKFLKLK